MNKIVDIKFGSWLYGTNTENSDLDLKSIYIPTAKEICLGSYKKTISTVRPKQPFEKNNKDDVDIEIFSLDRYLELLVQGQTCALDILFSNEESHIFKGENYAILRKIYENRFHILHKNISAFVSYAMNQAARYGIKGSRVAAVRKVLDALKTLPPYDTLSQHETVLHSLTFNTDSNSILVNDEHVKWTYLLNSKKTDKEMYLEVCNRKVGLHSKVKYATELFQKIFDNYGARALSAEKNEGQDHKALSHAVRVNSEAKELLETGVITFPRPDRELLLAIKKGILPYKEVAAIIEKGLDELKVAQINSSLRDTPNIEWVNSFLADIYGKQVAEWYKEKQNI